MGKQGHQGPGSGSRPGARGLETEKITDPIDFPRIQALGFMALDLDLALEPGAWIQGKIDGVHDFLIWSSQNEKIADPLGPGPWIQGPGSGSRPGARGLDPGQHQWRP